MAYRKMYKHNEFDYDKLRDLHVSEIQHPQEAHDWTWLMALDLYARDGIPAMDALHQARGMLAEPGMVDEHDFPSMAPHVESKATFFKRRPIELTRAWARRRRAEERVAQPSLSWDRS